ncbi:HNH endonuclease [Clostridium phage CWou-2020a]|uniref:HNH domain-containing protein n=1 Tax=Clostridium botulinum C/D str. DC5 TaxID=1443128 RepID=A0A0A0IJR6_CLOBO|nr:HNH endonuclease [Clostridium botulinum]QPW59424.1 HNH endonuclease [Clostridium phage CWou-2020a]KEI02897.1 hypothetical protein Y848_06445 [Clostridium botulinum C/D str. Sp77]KGN00834.1 hypothetical protein Z955_02435 [Clostridium botulinum C/D str. DC5]KOA76869.1 hypothetical protein ADU78_05270 [Clostridium botulinum]KOA80948.1 hypothetical protein ADU77_00195 [Clostridium botulinum]
MPVYRKCTECGNKISLGSLCKCEEEKRRRTYKVYKTKRLQDSQERERQRFYSNKFWLNLSEEVKKDFFGMCLMCWNNELDISSQYTHHIQTTKERFDLRLCKENLVPLCDSCHKQVHKLMDKSHIEKINIQKKLKELSIKFKEEFY